MALAIACWVRDTALQVNARDLNYQKAFLDAIYTVKTTMNTQVQGQEGYRKGNVSDMVSEAKTHWEQYKWIIK